MASTSRITTLLSIIIISSALCLTGCDSVDEAKDKTDKLFDSVYKATEAGKEVVESVGDIIEELEDIAEEVHESMDDLADIGSDIGDAVSGADCVCPEYLCNRPTAANHGQPGELPFERAGLLEYIFDSALDKGFHIDPNPRMETLPNLDGMRSPASPVSRESGEPNCPMDHLGHARPYPQKRPGPGSVPINCFYSELIPEEVTGWQVRELIEDVCSYGCSCGSSNCLIGKSKEDKDEPSGSGGSTGGQSFQDPFDNPFHNPFDFESVGVIQEGPNIRIDEPIFFPAVECV